MDYRIKQEPENKSKYSTTIENMSTQKTKRKNISEENLSVDKQEKFLKNRQTNRIYLTRNTKTALQVKKKNALNWGMSSLKR